MHAGVTSSSFSHHFISPPLPLQVKGKSCFWAELKNQQCHHQGKPVKFQAQRAQNSFCSFEWGRKRSNAWKMEQGVSIYIHKAKAKEQLLDNGFPATSPGALKGRDKSRAWSKLSSCRGRNSSETHYLPSMTFVGSMGISWAEGLKVFGSWEGEQQPPHAWIFSHTITIGSIFSLLKSCSFFRWGEMSREMWL